MRNARKQMAGLGVAVLVLVVAAGACRASVIANLSLEVDPVGKTWKVYATLTDPSHETLGLHGLYFDVWGSPAPYGAWSGGLAVNAFTNDLPQGMYFKPPMTFVSLGFYVNATGSAVNTGYELVGSMQSNTHTVIVDGGVTYDNILQGVGESAGSAHSSFGDIVWAHPVLVAHGTYTGDVGWLNVSLRKKADGTAESVWVVPASLPPSGNTFSTFYAQAGDNYRASVYLPEPATLALLGLGGLGLVLGRKRK